MAKINLNFVSWWKGNKGKVFKKSMIIYIAVLVLAFVISQIVLWSFLSSYQESLPETVAERYLKDMTADDWKALLKENIYGSSYSTADADTEAAYDMLFEGKPLKIRRSAKDSTDGKQIFKVTNGEAEICTLPLDKKGGGSFGMARWMCGKEAFTEAVLEKINPQVHVYLPKDAALTVNGIKVDKAGEAAESPFATPFEEANKDSFVKHSFRAPCGQAEISATHQSNILECTKTEDGKYCFDLYGTRISKTISVPEGSEVYVNDVRLTTDYISEKGILYPLLNPVEFGLEKAPKSTVYTVKGLYAQPDVRVIYNGEELSCQDTDVNDLVYAFNAEGVDYTVQVPANAKVTVNGVEISGKPEFISQQSAQYTEVSAYSSELVNPVASNVYTLKGLLFTPDIKVTDESGKEYPFTKLTATELNYTVPPSGSEIEEYEGYGIDFTVAMMEYLLEGRAVIDKNLAKLTAMTRKGSNAYVSLKDSYRGVYWRNQHTITYNDLHIENYVRLADNAFMCDAHYDVTGKSLSSSRETESKGFYRVLYIKTEDKWEIVEFTLMAE